MVDHGKQSAEALRHDNMQQNNDHSNFVDLTKSNPMKINNEHEVIKANNEKPISSDSETIAKLQKQNDKLRAELRELNSQLKSYLDKKKAPPTPKHVVTQDTAKDALRKELENAQKQLQIYARDVKVLQTKLEYAYNSDRLSDMEAQLAQKDKDMQKLVAEKKFYEKINRAQEKKPDQHTHEAEASALREEIRVLKQKVRELEEKDKQVEKAENKKHEHYVKIEEKYREVCHHYGIDPNAEMNKSTSKLQKSSVDSSKLINGKGDVSSRGKPSGSKQLTEAKFRELQNTIKILKKAHYSNEKKNKQEADAAQARIKELEAENKELAYKFRDKEKEANIMGSKISEMKRTFKRTLLPLGNYTPSKEEAKSISISTKNQVVPGIGGLRKEEKGKAIGNVQLFTDQELFKDKIEWKVSGFTIWLSSTGVSGLKAFYHDSHGEYIEGKKNVSNAGIAEYHSQDVRFTSGDYLKELSGTFDKSDTFVQSLSFLTAKGETHQVGNTTGAGKAFKFDINEYEYPAVVFGALEIETQEKDGERHESGSRLTKIGLLIKSDSVEERIEPGAEQGKSNQRLLTKSTDLKAIVGTHSSRLP